MERVSLLPIRRPCLPALAFRRSPLLSLSAQKTIDGELISSADIDLAVGDRWNAEFHQGSCLVAIAGLRAVVQLMGKIVGVVRVQDSGVA